MRRNEYLVVAAITVLLFLCAETAAGQSHDGGGDPFAWTEGYTLVLLSCEDMESVHQARDFIVEQGGQIALFSLCTRSARARTHRLLTEGTALGSLRDRGPTVRAGPLTPILARA